MSVYISFQRSIDSPILFGRIDLSICPDIHGYSSFEIFTIMISQAVSKTPRKLREFVPENPRKSSVEKMREVVSLFISTSCVWMTIKFCK